MKMRFDLSIRSGSQTHHELEQTIWSARLKFQTNYYLIPTTNYHTHGA